jgi:ubiquitin carboxyl-terminal hydrolase 7
MQIEAKKREREEQHLFLTARVCHLLHILHTMAPDTRFLLAQLITDETFQQHQGFDLATFDEKNWPASELPSFRTLKQETYHTFKSRVAQHFGYQESQFRLWVLVNRQNKTVRPDTPIPENEQSLSKSFTTAAEFGRS